MKCLKCKVAIIALMAGVHGHSQYTPLVIMTGSGEDFFEVPLT